MAEEHPPLLVSGSALWSAPLLGLLYGLSALGLLLLITIDRLAAERWPALDPQHRMTFFLGIAVLGVIASGFLLRYALPRKGSAELHVDHILLVKNWRAPELISLSELGGYSLPAAGFVQLHRGAELRSARRLTIPTPDAATRECVVSWLNSHGLSRRG